ncbi:MAG: GTPase Era [Balneolales bacterium]
MTSIAPVHKSGYVAIIGLPNAGKSTLLNAFLGQKLSIITPKAQTTRHRVTGIFSDDDSQIIFLDTPGIINPKYKLQEAMMAAVEKAERDADVILHLVDPKNNEVSPAVRKGLNAIGKPRILAVNKTDLISREAEASGARVWTEKIDYTATVGISALQGKGVAELLSLIKSLIPEGPAFYPKDQLSDHPERFFISEIIREKLFLQFQQEIPYSCAVNIVEYSETGAKDQIDAEIVVNRDSQKGMIIGKQGSAIKKLGIESRRDIEAFLGKGVNLRLFVKVREKWRENDLFVKNYGYKN